MPDTRHWEPPKVDLNTLRILQVEDSASDAALILRHFEKAGYEVHSERVEHADAMRIALRREAWDAVIADYHLPRFDAPHALAVLRETDLDLPFIVISGAIGEDVAVGMMKLGAHDYLMKDNLARLVPTVHREIVEASARRERRSAEAALRTSEQRFRRLAEAMPHLVCQTTRDGVTTYANQRWREYFGCDSLAASNWAEVVHPEDLPRFLELWEQALKTGQLGPCEARWRSHDGGWRWFANRFADVRDEAGNLLYWVGTLTDIHEEKLAEEQLRQTNEHLQQSNKTLEQFAYVASHDLQEPLRTIACFCDLLQRRYAGQLDESADEYLQLTCDAAQRMLCLIDDLLQFSRAGRRTRPLEPVDVGSIVDLVEDNLRVQIGETGAKLTRDRLPTVMADVYDLPQLFQNLISNALKYRKDDEQPAVHIGAVRDDGRWVFSIRDNGIGIRAEHFTKLFRVFQRLHQDGKYSGTGIGLAICQRIVERHGGRIWVESEPGVGSTFRFTLPAET